MPKGKRDIFPTLNNSDLIRCSRHDVAKIMFAVDLIRDELSPSTQCSKAIEPEMRFITTW